MPDAFVVAVPDTEKRARADSYQQQVSDGAGHFVVRGLNPGSFRVLAFEVLLDDWHKAGFLKMYAGKGETGELEEGGKKSVTVKIIVAEGAVESAGGREKIKRKRKRSPILSQETAKGTLKHIDVQSNVSS